MQSLSIELKGLILAATTVALLLGVIFGISSLIGATQAKPFGKFAAAPPPSAAPGTPSAPQDANQNTQLVEGHQSYLKSCAVCHGSTGLGVIGPSLRNLDLNDAQITAVIKTGVKGQMPAFGSVYDGHGLQALTAYLRSIQNPAEKAGTAKPKPQPSEDTSDRPRF